jgi:phosphatidylglycerol---prolipoprotein diacylglyceryl transferase
MYPDFGFFVHETFGVDIPALSLFKMFGFMLACAFFAAGYILHLELKRKEREGKMHGTAATMTVGEPVTTGELVGTGLYGFVFGAKFVFIMTSFSDIVNDPAAALFDPRKMNLWGVLGGLAVGSFFAYSKYAEKKKAQLPAPKTVDYTIMPHERTGDLIIVAAVSGLVGAKIFAISEYMDQFWADPIGTFFSGSGLAFFGGLIGGTIACLVFARYIKVSILQLMDAAAPSLIVGYGVGRIGCQLSGDGDWGIANTAPVPSWWFLPKWIWAYDFPHNVSEVGEHIAGCVGKYCNHLPEPVYPTSFYETLLCGLIFLILWALRKRIKLAGALFFLYFFLNGIERFLIEFVRVNDRYNTLGFMLSQAQLIAIGLMLTGVTGIAVLWWLDRKKNSAANF